MGGRGEGGNVQREYSKGGANDDTQRELSNFNSGCENPKSVCFKSSSIINMRSAEKGKPQILR